jgi:hypothetical protein
MIKIKTGCWKDVKPHFWASCSGIVWGWIWITQIPAPQRVRMRKLAWEAGQCDFGSSKLLFHSEMNQIQINFTEDAKKAAQTVLQRQQPKDFLCNSTFIYKLHGFQSKNLNRMWSECWNMTMPNIKHARGKPQDFRPCYTNTYPQVKKPTLPA